MFFIFQTYEITQKKLKCFVTSQPLAVLSIITVYCEVTAYT
jgi:hypothetical protein